jgi:hypothetical protein
LRANGIISLFDPLESTPQGVTEEADFNRPQTSAQEEAGRQEGAAEAEGQAEGQGKTEVRAPEEGSSKDEVGFA